MYKKILLSATLALVSMPLLAANYYVVVPSVEKAKAVAAIEVALQGAQLPFGTLDHIYSGFDLNTALRVSGDPAYDSSRVSWRVVSGSLPSGIMLSSAGILSGVPSSVGSSSFMVRAIYKTKAGEQSYQFVVRYAYDAAKGSIVSLSSDRQKVIAGDSTSILLTASVEDAGTVPATDGEVVSWSASKGTLGSSQSTTQAGFAKMSFVAPTTSGDYAITAKLNSTGVTKTTSVTVMPDLSSAHVASLVASPNSINADGVSQSVLTATIQDSYGNALGAGIDVHWSTTLGTLSATISTTNSAGNAVVMLTSTSSPGTSTVTSMTNATDTPIAATVRFLAPVSCRYNSKDYVYKLNNGGFRFVVNSRRVYSGYSVGKLIKTKSEEHGDGGGGGGVTHYYYYEICGRF